MSRDFPGDLVFKTLSFHYRGWGSICGQGTTRSHMPHKAVKKSEPIIFLNVCDVESYLFTDNETLKLIFICCVACEGRKCL